MKKFDLIRVLCVVFVIACVASIYFQQLGGPLIFVAIFLPIWIVIFLAVVATDAISKSLKNKTIGSTQEGSPKLRLINKIGIGFLVFFCIALSISVLAGILGH